MARDEAEVLVEAVRVAPARVGGELDEPGAPLLRGAQRPAEQGLADPLAAQGRQGAHALDLRAGRAAAGQARDDAQLQRADHLPAELGDGLHLAAVGGHPRERRRVGREVATLTTGAEGVVGEQVDDGLEVLDPSRPHGDLGLRSLPCGVSAAV